MKKAIALFILSIPLILFAQTDSAYKGIKWTESLSWSQIKEKAKTENKYVFVDCFATWCGPCKWMDKDVYPKEKVAEVMNSKFISVRAQMDTSKADKEEVQKWYADATSLKLNYNITGYPTFLFFSPQGQLVHKATGFQNPEQLVDLASSASNPQKQFYTLLEEYKSGEKKYSLFPYMITVARQIGETRWEHVLARDYLGNYLYKQKETELFSKENLIFISRYMQSTKERGFQLFLKNKNKIDLTIDQKGYAQRRIYYVIYIENVKTALDEAEKKQNEPDWKTIQNAIKKNWNNRLADSLTLIGRLNWYGDKKNWEAIAQYNIERIEKYGLDTIGIKKSFTNNMIWEVFFLHCNDKNQLSKASKWMELIVKGNPYSAISLDTYSNLLYKSGQISEAIKFETIAIKLDPTSKEMQEALKNMQDGVPTYVKDGAEWNLNTLPIKAKK